MPTPPPSTWHYIASSIRKTHRANLGEPPSSPPGSSDGDKDVGRPLADRRGSGPQNVPFGKAVISSSSSLANRIARRKPGLVSGHSRARKQPSHCAQPP